MQAPFLLVQEVPGPVADCVKETRALNDQKDAIRFSDPAVNKEVFSEGALARDKDCNSLYNMTPVYGTSEGSLRHAVPPTNSMAKGRATLNELSSRLSNRRHGSNITSSSQCSHRNKLSQRSRRTHHGEGSPRQAIGDVIAPPSARHGKERLPAGPGERKGYEDCKKKSLPLFGELEKRFHCVSGANAEH
jgi:hypothetical protein